MPSSIGRRRRRTVTEILMLILLYILPLIVNVIPQQQQSGIDATNSRLKSPDSQAILHDLPDVSRVLKLGVRRNQLPGIHRLRLLNAQRPRWSPATSATDDGSTRTLSPSSPPSSFAIRRRPALTTANTTLTTLAPSTTSTTPFGQQARLRERLQASIKPVSSGSFRGHLLNSIRRHQDTHNDAAPNSSTTLSTTTITNAGERSDDTSSTDEHRRSVDWVAARAFIAPTNRRLRPVVKNHIKKLAKSSNRVNGGGSQQQQQRMRGVPIASIPIKTPTVTQGKKPKRRKSTLRDGLNAVSIPRIRTINHSVKNRRPVTAQNAVPTFARNIKKPLSSTISPRLHSLPPTFNEYRHPLERSLAKNIRPITATTTTIEPPSLDSDANETISSRPAAHDIQTATFETKDTFVDEPFDFGSTFGNSAALPSSPASELSSTATDRFDEKQQSQNGKSDSDGDGKKISNPSRRIEIHPMPFEDYSKSMITTDDDDSNSTETTTTTSIITTTTTVPTITTTPTTTTAPWSVVSSTTADYHVRTTTLKRREFKFTIKENRRPLLHIRPLNGGTENSQRADRTQLQSAPLDLSGHQQFSDQLTPLAAGLHPPPLQQIIATSSIATPPPPPRRVESTTTTTTTTEPTTSESAAAAAAPTHTEETEGGGEDIPIPAESGLQPVRPPSEFPGSGVFGSGSGLFGGGSGGPGGGFGGGHLFGGGSGGPGSSSVWNIPHPFASLVPGGSHHPFGGSGLPDSSSLLHGLGGGGDSSSLLHGLGHGGDSSGLLHGLGGGGDSSSLLHGLGGGGDSSGLLHGLGGGGDSSSLLHGLGGGGDDGSVDFGDNSVFTGESALLPNIAGPTGDGFNPPLIPGIPAPPPVHGINFGGGAAGIPPFALDVAATTHNPPTSMKPSAILSLLNKADLGFNQFINHFEEGTPIETAAIDIAEVVLGSQKLDSQAKLLHHIDRTVGLDNLQRLQRWANTGGALDIVKEQMVKVLNNYKPPANALPDNPLIRFLLLPPPGKKR